MFDRHSRVAFSQEGEDLLIARLFDGQERGFFVDIGAHHPTRFSNTYLLYRAGWHGINVDATPGSMRAFRRKRRRDINLEVAVAKDVDSIVLHQFVESALNTMSDDVAAERLAEGVNVARESVIVPALPLVSILQEHLPDGTTIDLLTVDVEGADLEVLQSNDWSRFRPSVVVVEVLGSDLEALSDAPEILFLEGLGYAIHSKLHNSVILRDQSQS